MDSTNGKSKANVIVIWRLVVAACLIGFGSYLFHEVSAAPKTYATKAEVMRIADRLERNVRDVANQVDDIHRYLLGDRE